MTNTFKRLGMMLLGLALATSAAPAFGEDTKIVLIAGKPSHSKGEHEFNAGTKLLVKCLQEVPGGQPGLTSPAAGRADESVFDGAKSVVFFMDGGGGHPIIQGDHLAKIKKLMDKGVGLVCMHYAVEIPKDKGGKEFLDWLGGYYEDGLLDQPPLEGARSPACPSIRSPEGSSRSPSTTSGITTCGSAPR